MPGPLLLAGLAAGAGVLSGVIGNRERSGEAARNRRFQERMRNTEWQAGVEDMRKAGLNPALAYSQGGASSPSGSLAQQQNIGDEAVSTALAVKMQSEQLKLLEEQRKKTTLEGIQVGRRTQILGYEEEMARESRNFYFDIDGKPKGAFADMARAKHGQTLATSARSVQEAELARLTIPERKAVANLFERIGGGGAGVQALMPLLLQLMRNTGR